MIKANLERFLDNPLLGVGWLPIAETLVGMYADDEVDVVPFHCCYFGETCDGGHDGPMVKVRFLSDLSVVIWVRANDELHDRCKLDAFGYEILEFLGFTAPRTDKGEFAIAKKTRSALFDKQFVRVFKDKPQPEDLAEIVLNIMSFIFKCEPNHRYHFGNLDVQVKAVESIGVLERCDHPRLSAPFYWTKGSHRCSRSGVSVVD